MAEFYKSVHKPVDVYSLLRVRQDLLNKTAKVASNAGNVSAVFYEDTREDTGVTGIDGVEVVVQSSRSTYTDHLLDQRDRVFSMVDISIGRYGSATASDVAKVISEIQEAFPYVRSEEDPVDLAGYRDSINDTYGLMYGNFVDGVILHIAVGRARYYDTGLDHDLVDSPHDGKQYLRSDGEWVEVAASGGYADPLTTDGDLLLHSGGTTGRLPVGLDGQILTANGGAVSWETQTAVPTTLNDLTNVDLTKPQADGYVLTYSASLNQWLGAAPSSTTAAPTADETWQIGPGETFETLNDFLTLQQHRPLNQYTVTGEIATGYVIDEVADYVEGNFENVVIRGQGGLKMEVATTTTPFKFALCNPPIFKGPIELQALNAGQNVFEFVGCSNVQIAQVNITKASGFDPSVVWHMDKCSAAMIEGSTIVATCFDVVFDLVTTRLLVNTFTLSDSAKLFRLENGAEVQTVIPHSFPVRVTVSGANSATPLIEIQSGSSMANIEIYSLIGNYTGTILQATEANVSNLGIDFQTAGTALDVTHSWVHPAKIDVDTFSSDSVLAYYSDTFLDMQNTNNDGGTMYVVGGHMNTNKANQILYSEGARAAVRDVAGLTFPGTVNTIDGHGVLFYRATA